jgi:ketosteroid isomerase-like protein
MKKNRLPSLMAIAFALSIFPISCNTTINETTAKPDMAKIKAEIQALNTAWATAVNVKDAATILDLYADDAISMPDDAPALVGKAAIQQDVETSTANSKGVIAVSQIAA